MNIRWPRGRYNGRRVVGLEVDTRIDISHWALRWGDIHYGMAWAIGPLSFWIRAAYAVEQP